MSKMHHSRAVSSALKEKKTTRETEELEANVVGCFKTF
jgi:hypothetical protein